MKVKELRALTKEELEQELRRLREEAFNLRFQLATKKLTNYNRLTEVRKEIGRILTILREHELFRGEE